MDKEPGTLKRHQAFAEWCDVYLPNIVREYEKDGIPDVDARRESWNNFTDALCRDGRITDKQYEEWEHPATLETVRLEAL
jgi:hypothetical protein